MKALKIFYLVGLFGIIGAGPVRAVDWTLKGFRYGYCDIYDNATVSYSPVRPLRSTPTQETSMCGVSPRTMIMASTDTPGPESKPEEHIM